MSAEDLIGAFASEFGVAASKENRFGNPALGWSGVSDGAEGVQWNTWLDSRESAAYFGVNLEGLTYEGWPIARFIEREFRFPRLFDVARELGDPGTVELIFHRDAWQFASRPGIKEKHIGLSGRMLTEVDPAGWKATLQEAYACLDPEKGHRGRARQMVTVKKGPKEMSVSPHLQFRQRLSAVAAEQSTWARLLQEARRALQPLYDFVQEQSRP